MEKGLNTKPKQLTSFFDNYKALFTAAAFLFVSISVSAQIYQPPTVAASSDRRRRVDSTSMGPTGCGAPWALSALDISQKHSAEYFDSCNHRKYIYDPKLNAWDTIHIGVSGVGGSTNTSIGSAYKVAVNGTNNIKSLKEGAGIDLDSNTSGTIRIVNATPTQTENYFSYNIPFASTSFTDSTLVSQLIGGSTSYYFNKSLWLNGTYSSGIANSRLIAWNYGFLVNGNFSQKLLFKVGDSSAFLTIGIGVKGAQFSGSGIDQVNYLTATIADSTVSSMTNTCNSHTVSKSSGILVNYGDIIELQVNQIADSVQFFYRNLTNNNSYRLTRKIDFTTNTQYRSTLGYPAIYFAKGNVKLISYSVYKNDFNYVFLGNSITEGYRTSGITGFVNQLRQYTGAVINNMARAAVTSTDYVSQVKDNFNFTNKTVFVSGLCGNDPTNSITAATSKANYQAVVSLLRAKGNRIVHIDNPYRTIFLGAGGMADLTALNNWIDTTYGGIDTIIHTQVQTQANYPGWYTDGAHLNATGNTALTNIILNKVPDLFPLQQPLKATTVDTIYYKPTVKDTSGREYKVSWNNFGSGGSMVYPGAGIPLSTGSAWGTSITDNSTNWNTAYTNRITSATAPLSISSNVISIANAGADGTTKGAASFVANDFDATSGNIGIDYTNGQAASTSLKGFLTNTDWNTFNGKQAALVSGANIKTVSGTSLLGSGDLGIIGTAYGGTGVDNSTGGTANQFWARPNGATGAATYRAIVAADIPVLNQNTTGSAATLTTPRAIYGNNFDGSAALAQIIASTYGGTGNGFTKFSGPTTSEKTFTLPNASATILTDNAVVTAAQGGTGINNSSRTLTINTNAGTIAFPSASTTMTFPSASQTLASLAGTETLSNKTLTAPVIASIVNTGTQTVPTVTGTLVQYAESSTASSSTPAPSGDARANWLYVTALAANATVSAPSGTPANGNQLVIRIKDNATARTLAWNAIYRASSDLALPTTTIISKTLYIGFVYNSTDSKWDLVSVLNNF